MVVEEDFGFSGDFVLSKIVPGDVVLGFFELVLEADSVFSSLVPQFLVQVHHLSEFFNGGGSDELISLILSVGSVLGISVGLLKVIQQAKDGIDGITSLGTSLEKGQDLILG